MLEDDIECESFTVICIDFLFVYLQAYLDTCAYKIANKQIIIDITISNVTNVDYRCITQNISKSEAINLLKNSVLEDPGYI